MASLRRPHLRRCTRSRAAGPALSASFQGVNLFELFVFGLVSHARVGAGMSAIHGACERASERGYDAWMGGWIGERAGEWLGGLGIYMLVILRHRICLFA